MIGLTSEQVNKLFALAGIEVPAYITKDDISRTLIELEKKISCSSYFKNTMDDTAALDILVVDDLELSIHQLSILLSKSGYNVYIARTSEEAVQQIKKHSFDYVLVDLFLPEYTDGLEIVNFIKNFKKTREKGTKVVVISGTDDKELVNKCYEAGASEFIEKSPDWHKNILKYIRQSENQKNNAKSDIVTEVIDEKKKIIAMTVRNIHKSNVINEIEKEIVAQANSGFSNIILDLKNVKSISNEHTAMFIIGYKACHENKGLLTLCNVAPEVNDALTYVFLHNIIKICKDRDEALSLYNS